MNGTEITSIILLTICVGLWIWWITKKLKSINNKMQDMLIEDEKIIEDKHPQTFMDIPPEKVEKPQTKEESCNFCEGLGYEKGKQCVDLEKKEERKECSTEYSSEELKEMKDPVV